jgi:hypothetical protein
MDPVAGRLCLWDATADRPSLPASQQFLLPMKGRVVPDRGRTLGVSTARWRSDARLGAARDAASLRDLWQGASVAAGWAHATDWWCAEVDAVTESVADGADLTEPIARLARSRAETGVGLGEALDDLCSLYEVLPLGAPPAVLVRVFAEAWADVGVEPIRSATCEDPLTGLTSAGYLRTRLAEIYRESDREGRSVSSTHALVVVSTGAHGAVRWDGLLRRLALGECLRSVFSGGETLTALGSSAVVGLVTRTPLLTGMVESLRRRLGDSDAGIDVEDASPGGGGASRVWVEGLPDALPDAYELIEDLAR